MNKSHGLKLCLKVLLSILPVLIYEILFVFCEPNNYFGLRGTERDGNQPISAMRYAMNGTLKNVIIGDSRVAGLNTTELYSAGLSNKEYYNLAFNGATTLEKCDMFWWADKYNDLETVVIEINFWNSQRTGIESRIGKVTDVVKDPAQFISNRNYNHDFLTKLSKLRENDDVVGNTEELSDETYLAAYQNYAINIWDGAMQCYRMGKDIYELIKVVEYCNQNNIEIRLVSLPMHRYVWNEVIDANEMKSVELYKAILSHYAPIYDMEYLENIYTDSTGYADGNHLRGYEHISDADFSKKYPLTAEIINLMFNGEGENYRVISNALSIEEFLHVERVDVDCPGPTGIINYELPLIENNVYEVSFNVDDVTKMPELFYMDMWGADYDDVYYDLWFTWDENEHTYRALIDLRSLPSETKYFRIVYQGVGSINISDLTVSRLDLAG